MDANGKTSDTSFTSVATLVPKCGEKIPEQYVLPPLQRPNRSSLSEHISTQLPIIDLSMLNHPANRCQLINEVQAACKKLGFFQAIYVSNFHCSNKVINHGIPTSLIKDALDCAEEFFNLPSDEKTCFASTDVHQPVRYGTSMNHGIDKVLYWRDFIKLYANPLSDWIHLWPSDPPSYKEKMGSYAKAVHILHKKLMEVVLETLGLNANYLQNDIEEGSQVMAVNCYPSCPEPDLALGMPPHTDYGTLTILNQSHQGLEVFYNEHWHTVPFVKGALIVQLGDQFEVMSNARYKGIPHRAILNIQTKRISIASLHSMKIEKKVGPAPELVDEQHPVAYKEGSFGEFLDHISGNSLSECKYIDTLKVHERMVD